MRKIFVLALITALSVNLFAQTSENSKFRVGIGTLYTSEVENYGITAKGVYTFTPKWELSAAYSHVFENYGLSWDVIDIDGHFVFYNNQKKFSAYALAGLALTYWERETLLLPNHSTTGTYAGMNLGAGANIKLGQHFNLSPEIRGTIFDLSYTRMIVTIQYMF